MVCIWGAHNTIDGHCYLLKLFLGHHWHTCTPITGSIHQKRHCKGALLGVTDIVKVSPMLSLFQVLYALSNDSALVELSQWEVILCFSYTAS